MRKLITTIALVAITTIGFTQKIDGANSYIEFEIDNMIFNTVEGKITGMTGTVNFNESDLSHSGFNVCIDPASVDTDSEDRDKHLQNADFFDVSKYTTICFTSTSITKDGSSYRVKGKLTLFDTTSNEEITFKIEGNKLVGEMEIDRFDYNLAVKEYDGTAMVGDDVTIKIVCTLIK
ncbi:MAG: YceI family protein [Flavobacteriales bacterium]|nr:YceI family protein [Flavobacteriales bacterium]